MIFEYGEKEMDWLSRRDARMGRLIGRVGKIRRELQPDLFRSLAFNIVGQQISMAAQKTVWGRLESLLGEVTPRALAEAEPQALRQLGLNGRKVEYLQELARNVAFGRLDLEALTRREDEEVIRVLSAQKGVGVWTAEMMLIFSLGRPDVLSWGDLGIRRGMEMLYGKALTRQDFERYKKRYSPYGTVASFYLWELAGGRAEGWQSAARFSRFPEKEGTAEGELIGGNLTLTTGLVAGKYKINFKNKILFLEELGYESDPSVVSRNLYFMKQNGVFDEINGLWIGNYEHISEISLEKIVTDVIGNEYNFPIIKSNNFGHNEAKIAIPIGVKAKIDTNKEIKIELLEKCVR